MVHAGTEDVKPPLAAQSIVKGKRDGSVVRDELKENREQQAADLVYGPLSSAEKSVIYTIVLQAHGSCRLDGPP